MKLFYIHINDVNGDNLDLFVSAKTPQEALELWRAYFEPDPSMLDDSVWIHMREVPQMAELSQAHAWENLPNHILHRDTGVDVDAPA